MHTFKVLLKCEQTRKIQYVKRKQPQKINPQLLLLAEHHINKRVDVKEISDLIPIKLPRCQRISQNLHFDLNLEAQHSKKLSQTCNKGFFSTCIVMSGIGSKWMAVKD